MYMSSLNSLVFNISFLSFAPPFAGYTHADNLSLRSFDD